MSGIHQIGWDTDSVDVRFRCEVVAEERKALIEKLAEVLRAEGYFVAPAAQWEKTSELRKRLGLSHDSLHRIMTHPHCPPVDVDRGAKRITAISSNPAFESFCRALRGATPKSSVGKTS
ncbi:MAG TPA: hypothetical protein VK474_00815 [Chthoniobacterales bacterium]|nr:hypothetical protein [Chthoniobacterales bacterium]